MSTPLIVLGILLMSAAVVLAYRPTVQAAVPAYAALWLMRQGGLVALSQGAMLYWGIATILVILLDAMQPRMRGDNRGQAYICTGILAGLTLGLLSGSQAGSIIGACAGAILGAMAYRRTPAGQAITGGYIGHCLAKGFPALVALCQLAPVLQSLLTTYVQR